MRKSDSAAEDRAKAKSVKPLRALWPFLRPHRQLLAAALTMLVVAAVFTLLLPLALRRVIDLGFDAENAERVDQYFIAMIVVAGALAAATAARFYFVTRLGERVIADVRKAVYDRVIGRSPAFFEQIQTGEVLSRLTTDVTVIQSVVGSSASIALRNILILFGGLAMLIATSPKLSGLVLLTVPLVVFPVLTLGRRVRKLSRESQDRVADASAMASETLLAAQTVQAYTHEARARARFGGLVEQAFTAARRRVEARAALTVIVIFLVFTGVVGVMWIGARDVMAGEKTAGELGQFIFYAAFVAGAVGALSEVWGELMRAAGATERLVELLEAEDAVEQSATPKPPATPARGAIRFEGVGFRYPARPQAAALSEIGFEIAPGETVALVGPSGAGKTTIFQLLLRFYDASAGAITVDGVDVRDMSAEGLRSRFALVPQEPAIFADTARENIRFGRPGATDAEVETAAKAAAAHDFLMKLPQGYDSYVGERGVMLSGGQKQRIAIARAILRDAPILLLDEATSALDAESERAVQQAVDRLSRDRTTLVIAHRLATVKRADRIIVFDEGRIIAQGPHDRLVAEGGLYARLARLQFSEGAIAAE
ncbi:ABC transporter transmembrane domain-containing protein [Rubrimonas cliftonensis]|uniref:ATP-binding cassette, subfamily B n=1 Tax=Rubrimonas cliftonensis TaxID=89524 RepID=A0A1H4C5T5_9RHOB|nr:ABC transporter transmembrane domain-containing protein [Rubrimonas cliftonensis]SEA55815.1 ATP-binding cassette, subfamily B [Rubrimonas cliftonensis]